MPRPPACDLASHAVGAHPRIGLIDGENFDIDVFAEHAALGGVIRYAVDAGQRIRRQRRPEPLDDVAVVVVMRRLDEKQHKSFARL